MRPDTFPDPLARHHAGSGLPARGPALLLACFDGGKSSSATTTTTTTTTTSKQVGASDQARVVAVESGGPVTIESLEPAVIEAALEKITDFASGVGEAALSTNAQVIASLLEKNRAFDAETQAAIGQIVRSNLETVAELAKTTTTGGLNEANRQMLLLGVAGAIALAAVGIAVARK